MFKEKGRFAAGTDGALLCNTIESKEPSPELLQDEGSLVFLPVFVPFLAVEIPDLFHFRFRELKIENVEVLRNMIRIA